MKKNFKKFLGKLGKERKKKQGTSEKKRDIWAGSLFVLIGGGMAIFSAILLWDRVLTAPDLEKVLPEKGLVFFVNMETFTGFQTLVEKNEWWNQQYKTWLNTFFGLHLDEIIRWRGERGALALYDLSGGVEKDALTLVSFVSVKKGPEARKFLEERSPEKQERFQKKYTIYSYLSPREYSCAIFSGYLTCAEEKLVLQHLLESRSSNTMKLVQSEDFKRTAAELPRNHAIRFFGRAEPLFYNLSDFSAQRSFLPLAKTIAAVGGTLTENTNHKTLELHLLFLRNKLSPEKDLSNEKVEFRRGVPSILSFLPTNATFFVWGNDLQEDFLNGFRYFQEIDPVFEVTVRNVLRQYVADLFDGEISWELDLFPLLEGEFVFGSDPEGVFAIIKTGDAEFAQAKRERMQKGLVKMSAKFVPKIVTNTLEDGTRISEMFPNENAVVTEKVDHEEGTIFTIETKDEEGNIVFSLSFGQKEDILILGTPREKVAEMLETSERPEIMKNFPIKFAGPSEEVFAFLPGLEYLERYLKIPEERMFKFVRGTGKVVTTPLYLRIIMGVEL